MASMKEIKRVSAGVKFESDVLGFIDRLAEENQRNRSFVINQIIRHYARTIQQQQRESAPPATEKAIALIQF